MSLTRAEWKDIHEAVCFIWSETRNESIKIEASKILDKVESVIGQMERPDREKGS